MAIWFQPFTVADLNRLSSGMVKALGIAFTDVGEDTLTATMPVNDNTRQPFGLLHGGANVALAETLASVATGCVIDFGRQHAVGLEINANHLAAARDGLVTGVVRPLHLGRSTHVWDIRIHNAEGKLSCVSRCTMAVLAR